LGYVPLWKDDPAYIAEQQHGVLVKMPNSNKNNFDEIMADVFTTPLVRNIKSKYPAKKTRYRKRKYNENEDVIVNTFKDELLHDFHEYYNTEIGSGGPVSAEDIFGEQEAEAVVSYLNHMTSARELRGIIGGECFEGQLEWLMQKVIRLKDLLRLAPIATTTEQVRKSNTRTTTNIIPPTLAPNPASSGIAPGMLEPLLLPLGHLSDGLNTDDSSVNLITSNEEPAVPSRSEPATGPEMNIFPEISVSNPPDGSSNSKRPTKKALASAASRLRRLELEAVKGAKDLSHSRQMAQIKGFMKDVIEGRKK
ncbi:hypothetical protein KEM48_011929, partial [Puccinia striiformis f. sp. tritici PST-130]